MRYLIGVVAIAGAVLFIGYSAVVAWHSAYSMTTATKFPELAGWAAVGVIITESTLLAIGRQLWKQGEPIMALLAFVFLAAASMYLLRLDVNFYIAGQADIASQRSAVVSDNAVLRAELEAARAERDALNAEKRLNTRQALALERAVKRIADLESRWETRIVVAGDVPEATLAARLTRWDEQLWKDLLLILPVVVFCIGRIVALPLSLAVFPPLPAARRRDPTPGVEIQPDEEIVAGKDLAPARVQQPTPARLGSHPLTELKINAPKSEDWVDVFVRECLHRDEGGRMKSRQVFELYKRWCNSVNIEPVGHQTFAGLFLAATQTKVRKSGGQNYYMGWRIRDVRLVENAAA